MSNSGAPLGKEDTLNLAFANAVEVSGEFRSWLLRQTKFRDHAEQARLLKDEQERARTARFWWRHWWCNLPELGGDSETDILLAFEGVGGNRFCLHIENKLAASTFTPGQELNYSIRANYMLANTKFAKLRCTDFETILIAPTAFIKRHHDQSSRFGCVILHENISKYIPQFDEMIRELALSAQLQAVKASPDATAYGAQSFRKPVTPPATTSISNPELACPTCKGANFKKLALVYGSGTSSYKSTSLTTGIANRGRGVRITTTEGKRSTLLAAACAPPVQKTSPAGAFIVAGLLLGAGAAIFINAYLGLFNFIILVIAGIQGSKKIDIKNAADHLQKMEEWNSSFVCMRCGTKFKPITAPD